MKLPFKDIGNGNPVILIHAFPLSSKMWESQAELLVRNGYRVILPDLPGFGENNDFTRCYSIAEMASKISELVDSLNITQPVIGGLSMGGYVLFELIRIAPDKFSGLILCDTTFSADTEEKRLSRFDLISKIENQGSSALIENMLPNLVSDYTKQNNPRLLEELKELFLTVEPSAAMNALRSMAERNDNSEILDKINFPVLLIFGEFDKVTNLENGRKMNELIPVSELAIIKKAGHYSNLEQPEQFNQKLLDFISRIKF